MLVPTRVMRRFVPGAAEVAFGSEAADWGCRHGASFALYVVGVCLNRIGTHQTIVFFLEAQEGARK